MFLLHWPNFGNTWQFFVATPSIVLSFNKLTNEFQSAKLYQITHEDLSSKRGQMWKMNAPHLLQLKWVLLVGAAKNTLFPHFWTNVCSSMSVANSSIWVHSVRLFRQCKDANCGANQYRWAHQNSASVWFPIAKSDLLAQSAVLTVGRIKLH